MPCPYRDENYPVNVIRHNHKNGRFRVGKMLSHCLPIPARYLTEMA